MTMKEVSTEMIKFKNAAKFDAMVLREQTLKTLSKL